MPDRQPISRRHVLRGAGGFTLALPFLPSLLPRAAVAAPALARPRRFVCIRSEHGGIDQRNMFPDASTLTDKITFVPGHDIWRGTLKRTLDGNDAVVSPVLRASATVLTDRLVSKLNVLRGLDVPFYMAHNVGGDWGNFAAEFGGTTPKYQGKATPTVDQAVAWSPSFYASLDGIRERSLALGDFGGASWNYSNASGKSGPIQGVAPTDDPVALFTRLFDPARAYGIPRKPVVDRIIESYRALRTGNRRLSADDRQRLDDHVDRLAELDRRLRLPDRMCGNVTKPAAVPKGFYDVYRSADMTATKWRALVDVLVAAFACGLTRVASLKVSEPFSSYSGDWHQSVAHRWMDPDPQRILTEALRLHYQTTLFDLAAKMDAIEDAPGVSMLDDSLLMATQECGMSTHDPIGLPVVTLGSAGGALRTGNYCDYRNQVPTSLWPHGDKAFQQYQGVLYAQWLGSALQALGVPRSEWEKPGMAGYGYLVVDTSYVKPYAPGVVEGAGELLPFLKA